jgi:Fic family protein
MKRTDFTSNSPGRTVSIGKELIAFIPDPLPPELALTPRISGLCDDAMIALGGLRQIIPFLPNPHLMTGPFLRREAVLSSKIEGTYTNLEQLYLFEAEGNEAGGQGPDASDAREVLNYVRALQHGLARIKEIPICGRLLKEMHAILIEGLPTERGANKRPGEFRDNQAYIGSRDIVAARYVAPPEGEINRLFSKFERFINSDDSSLSALIWIAAIHYQFEAIHPFADGNGRIGRVLVSLLLATRKLLPEPLLYLSAYFERHREEYARHLWDISRSGSWEAWIEFFLEGVKREAEDASARARKLLSCREQFLSKFRGKRGKAADLIETLFCNPVISVRMAQERLKLKTYPGAQKTIDALEECGLLVLARTKPKMYIAKPIVDIVYPETPTEAERDHPKDRRGRKRRAIAESPRAMGTASTLSRNPPLE